MWLIWLVAGNRDCPRRGLSLFLVALWCALVSPPPVLADAPQLLLGDDYPRAASEAIQGAVSTVDLAVYFIIVDPDAAGDPVALLVEALVAAHRRGVRVTVVVEDGKAAENAAAVAMLRSGGVIVQADAPARLLHAKALVVDERIVLVGSANWSRAAFIKNAEASVRLEDPALGRALAQAIRGWAAAPAARTPVGRDGVSIPAAWLAPGGLLSRLVETRADAAFRLALAFARDGAAPDSRQAWQPYWEEFGIRHPRTQRKLRQRFTTWEQGQSPAGTVPVPVARGLSPEGGLSPSVHMVPLPKDFWPFGYARTLSTRAQFAYLVARAEALRSTRNPCWFRSQDDLAAATGVSDTTLSLGFLELERENLVEIHRGDAPGEEFADRPASVTCVNPLVSPADRQAALEVLSARYPVPRWRDARTIAASLNDPYDPVWLDALAQALQRHGAAAVRRAHREVLRRKPGSPGRTVAALLQGLASQPSETR